MTPARRGPRLLLLLALAAVFAAPALTQAAPPAKPAAPPAPAAPAPAADQARERATGLMRQGNDAYAQGEYLKALALFQQAFAAFPSPRIHFNLGQTNAELGRTIEALEHYERFLAGVKREGGPEQWDIAYKRAFQLRGSIAQLDIHTNLPGASVVVDGRAVGSTPLAAPLRLLPGPHVLVFGKAGHEQQVVQVTVKAGETASRRVTLLTEEEALSNRRSVQKLAEERRQAEEGLQRAQAAEAQRRASGRRQLRLWGWTALGTGAASLILGATFAGLSQREADRVDALGRQGASTWDQASGHYDRAASYRYAAWGLIASGAVVATTGVVLLQLSRRQDRERAPRTPPVGVTAAIQPGGGGLTVRGVF
jgi:tetratricopeptide (TPR) repeat protein